MSIPEKLKRFAEAFPDEDSLRLAMIELLGRIPNVSEVRLNHERGELGKDILFRESGSFKQELVACVVKNTKITGSASSVSGANNVFIQAKQALTAGLQTLAGNVERADKVLVICPHDCRSETVASIHGELQERRERVIFIVGTELLEMFSKYYPEFLVQQSSTFGAYVKSIEEGLNSGSPVDSILLNYGLGSRSKPVSGVYVPPDFFCEVGIHEVEVTIPRVLAATKSLTQDEVRRIGDALQPLAQLLDAALPFQVRGRSLVTVAGQLTKDLRAEWRQAYSERRRAAESDGTHLLLSRSAVSLDLGSQEGTLRSLVLFLVECELYLKQFFRALDRANAFADLAGTAEDGTFLQQAALNDFFYISSVQRQVPGIVKLDRITRHISFDFTKAVDVSPKLLIAGPAGFGKTTFCNQHLLRDLEEFREGASRIVPVLVPLHRLSDGKLENFAKTILRSADLVSLWNDRSTNGLRFRLYLDGLDEIANPTRQAELMNFIGQIAASEPELQLIVTGRDHVAGPFLREFVRIRVAEMTDHKIQLFVTKWLREDTQLIADFMQQLEHSPQLKDVLRVPLLATLTLSMFEGSRTLPQSRVSLYNAFVSLLAGGWDVAKRIQKTGEYGVAPKLSVLTRLAADLHLARRRDFVLADFRAAVTHTVQGLQDQVDALLTELVQDSLVVPVGSAYIFSHLSYQEFLAAKNLLQPSEHRVKRALADFLAGDDWWRDVLVFYIGLLGQPKEIEELVHRGVSSYLSKNKDYGVVSRAHYLLEAMMSMIPGSLPSFRFGA